MEYLLDNGMEGTLAERGTPGQPAAGRIPARRRKAGFFLAALACAALCAAFFIPASAWPASSSAKECLNCHGMKELEKAGKRGHKISLFVDLSEIKGSIHQDIDCLTCHPKAKDTPHEKIERVDCGQCHAESIVTDLAMSIHGGGSKKVKLTCTHCHGKHSIKRAADDHFFPCQNCHTGASIQYKSSIHQKVTKSGKLQAASCQDCHGGHRILRAKDPASSVYPLNLPRTCAKCHGAPQQAKKGTLPHRDIYHLYLDTVHGIALDKGGLLVAAVCTSCHGAHDIQSHTAELSSTHRHNIPQTCGRCHAGVLSAFEESVHGKWMRRGDMRAPTCTDCHTAHEIRRVDTYKWKLSVIQECGTCHEQSLKTFRDTFHGQVSILGYARSARCSDCHGYHDVLPSRDHRSATHPSRLLATCQKCHPNATPGFTEYYPHADHKKKEQYPILHRTYFFMSTILIGTFAFFGLHTVLWLPRSLRERLNRKNHNAPKDSPSSPPENGAPGPAADENISEGKKT